MAVRAVLVGLLAVPLAAAAPVPMESDEKLKRLFGTPVDPAKDWKFGLDGKKLRITVPDAPHPLETDRKLGAVPRVVRQLTGDFTARVRVRILLPDAPKSAPDPGSAIFLAGLLVAAGEDDFVSWGDGRLLIDGQVVPRGVLRARLGGAAMPGEKLSGDGFKGNSAVVRVERAGREVLMSVLRPAGDWFLFQRRDVGFPRTVTLGLYAAHNAATGFTAGFDELEVTPLGPGK